jgi:two-component system CheB/CheR fusion protein
MGRKQPPQAKRTFSPPRRRKQSRQVLAIAVPMADQRDAKLANETDRLDFPVVGIGASAGGLKALEEFFDQVSLNSGLAYVVVIHQSPGHGELLTGVLKNHTAVPVLEAVEGMAIEPNHVYTAPGGQCLSLDSCTFTLKAMGTLESSHLAIDHFLRSLAIDQKNRAVGIILSGAGTDGTLGMRAIKGEEGITIVQDPFEAEYSSMPKSAIASGAIDFILPVARMPEQLQTHWHGIFNPTKRATDESDASQLRMIFSTLRARTGLDFFSYKEATVRRRIERRMRLHQIGGLKEYQRFLLGNPIELNALSQELLIGVTNYFRDAAAFEVLAKKGLPRLIAGKPEGYTLRVWVPACSTGEEAYSHAIALKEYLNHRKIRMRVQIFATDVDGQAIETARAGFYSAGIANDMAAGRLQQFFKTENGGYRVKKDIRDLVIFAKHNILMDPPFMKLDVISCRNLLIYLDTRAQQQVLLSFHHALKPHGLLMLGSCETVGDFEDLFTPIDRKWKIFVRTEAERTGQLLETFLAKMKRPSMHVAEPRQTAHAEAVAPVVSATVENMLVNQFVPASVIVNMKGEVMYIHGRTGMFLEPPAGTPTGFLLEMARPDIRSHLATALHQAVRQKSTILRRGIPVETDRGKIISVTLGVKRIDEPKTLAGFLLVTFNVDPQPLAGGKKGRRSAAWSEKSAKSGMVEELQQTKQRLQLSIEQLQTSNEELTASNEELQSTNEELQSTNEELEAAKEELHSLNEELNSLNGELQTKLDDLGAAKDDLQNLLNSTEVATVFLDQRLNIRRFTPNAQKIIHLIPSDIGRPFSDISTEFTYPHVTRDAAAVLETLVYREREVEAADGSWYFMRILPYRSAQNSIQGVVLAFLDITRQKESERVAKEAQTYAEHMVETVREPLIVLDDQLRIVSANKAFLQTFQTRPAEVEGRLIFELGDGQWSSPELKKLLSNVLPDNHVFTDFHVQQAFPRVGHKSFLINGRRLNPDGQGSGGRIVMAFEDITGREPEQRSLT